MLTQAGVARWVVDTSGRGSIIKRQLGMRKPSGHGANAVWFRVKGRIKVDDWSTDPAWVEREPSKNRWLSTVHLMGRGYWVWLIPLGSGSTSIGIVADGDLHPFTRPGREACGDGSGVNATGMQSLKHLTEKFAAMD